MSVDLVSLVTQLLPVFPMSERLLHWAEEANVCVDVEVVLGWFCR